MWRLPATLLVVVTLLVDGSYQVRAAAFDDDDGDQQQQQQRNLHSIYPATRDEPDNFADDWKEIFAEEYRDMMGHGDVDQNYEEPFSGKLVVVEDWPVNDLHLGQVGGVATDPEGYLHVFHRADRTWEYSSFDANNTFQARDHGPIKEPTLYTVNASNGVVLNKRAENFFYLPHGLTIDRQGNFWMTDVAMHQVFKFKSAGERDPSLVLGMKFEPARSNEDTERFCEPTDVAVASNDDFFVADGYCASRVLKYSKAGELIGLFAVGDSQIPHSLALAEDLDLLCVADRENMRILCYNAGLEDPSRLGEPEREYIDEILGRIYAIEYSPKDGLLYGVTGPTGFLTPQGFTIDLVEDERYSVDIIATWSPDDKGFDQPHDLTVSPDGEAVFVGEISPNVVWKFVKDQQ